MKNTISEFIFGFVDLIGIFISIILGYYLANVFIIDSLQLSDYLNFYPIYMFLIFVFLYEGIYTYRYDFWHESKLLTKGILFNILLIFSYITIAKINKEFSVTVLLTSYVMMILILPINKFFIKRYLFKIGLWRRKVKIISKDDKDFVNEIFNNHYLGYVNSDSEDTKTVFINSKNKTDLELKKLIDKNIYKSDRVIFVPRIDSYELSQCQIYSLNKTRSNLVVLKNKLKSKYRQIIHNVSNYILAILLLPILLPIIGILAYLIKKESKGPVFFAHNRIGKDRKTIPTFKFRSMFKDSKERLEKLLEEDEEIKKEWETNFKLKNDPRITKVGAFLRKTSLDELPQIFNVLRGEMNFVGPRPVILEELDKYYKENAEYYLMVKPGITGLWQVSGRSDTDYDFRVSIDKWYIINWSLWLDITILIKTIKVVLKKEGAY